MTGPGKAGLREAVQFFKADPGYHRLFAGMREKYRSYGFFGGIITLESPTREEIEALSAYLGKPLPPRSKLHIKVEAVLKAHERTRYSEFDFSEVLELYFDEPLVSKKEEAESYTRRRDSFFKDLLGLYGETRAGIWLSHLIETRRNAWRMLASAYDANHEELKQNLCWICNALNSIGEGQKTRLALLGANVSNDPHRFDADSFCGRVLISALSFLLGLPEPENAEERSELLYLGGILDDEISNHTASCNLQAFTEGVEHAGWKGFRDRGEILQLNLSNLEGIDTVFCNSRRLFAFENPTVFREVHDRTQYVRPSMLCTNGQVKLASLVLLDKLAENVDSIFYSGDFDPEGLLIAEKLRRRYGSKVVFWRYDVSNYLRILSPKTISHVRLKKLELVKSRELQDICEAVRQTGCAAYQEMLIPLYVEDILSLLRERSHCL